MNNQTTKRAKTKEYDVEDIMDDRMVKIHEDNSRKYKLVKEYLVKWVGYKRRTWEPEENLKNCPLILERYLKSKKESEEKIIDDNNSKNGINNKEIKIKKNDIYNQLLKLSACQMSNNSYQNFGPCFQEVININAIITKGNNIQNNNLPVESN